MTVLFSHTCLIQQTEDFGFVSPIPLIYIFFFSVAIKKLTTGVKNAADEKKNNNPDRYRDAARDQRRFHGSFLSKKI